MVYRGAHFDYTRFRFVSQEEIHRKTISSKLTERRGAAYLFRHNFAHFRDKELAFEDLHRLTQDEDHDVRRIAAESLGEVFPYIPDKGLAFEDLDRLINDKEFFVKRAAVLSLGAAFPHIPEEDMEQAWEDIQQLTQDKNSHARRIATLSLGAAFPHISDKNIERAWEVLHRLAQDREGDVRSATALSLGAAFPYISGIEREKSWEDLHRLTKDRDHDVLIGVALSLGAVFPLIPNEEQALEDLHRLTENKDHYVRAFANYSLGRASIFKAVEAESVEAFRKELKMSLEFFVISLIEETTILSLFCFSFYSSFYAIIFEGKEAEAEVQRYIEETRNALRSSGDEEKLLEAIENAKNSLEEIHGLREVDLESMKRNLIVCMQYCYSADFSEYVEEEIFPVEINIISRVLPAINQRIEEKVLNVQYESLGKKPLTPKKWQCISCGTQVPSGAQFCPHCGEPINTGSV